MDRLTDRTNLIGALYSVVNASENDICLIIGLIRIKYKKDHNGRQYIK